jgi:hypothetical protein
MVESRRSLGWLGLLSAFALFGCGSEAASLAPTACSAAAIEGCLVNQQACVAEAAGPRCSTCADGSFANAAGTCAPIAGKALEHDFAMFSSKAGEEILGLCQSWTLNNAEEIWVNTVELRQDTAEHHSNWTFVPDDQYPGADGVWPCDDRQYSQLKAALAGGVLYAQSTQATHEVQRFPNGAAVRIPPYSRIIGDVHVLNTTEQAVTGHIKLTVYEVPKADVKVKLVPFHMTYQGLAIPPQATSRFTGNCKLNQDFMEAAGVPFGMKVYYGLPHTHKLGSRFFFSVIGGPHDGESLLDVHGFNGEARGKTFDPPIDLTGAQGLRFGCEFENPRPVEVDWGFGDQEMCEMLGFAESPVGFESSIDAATPAGMDGATQLFTSSCSTLAFKWNFDKPGGPGPM